MLKYLVSGWDTYSFVITPEELREITSQFHWVINNRHVPIDYIESSPNEYIEMYSTLFQKLSQGEKIDAKKDNALLEHSGLTTDLARCPYGREHIYNDTKYKAHDFDEPCVNIAPFPLSYQVIGEKISVSTRGSYIQSAENVIGLEISYPKKIQFPANQNQYTPLVSTKNLPSYEDFEKLKESIKSITKPLNLKAGEQIYRTKVRVSKNALEVIPNFYIFSSAHNEVDRCIPF